LPRLARANIAGRLSVEQRFYNNVDHGYATTIHKSQGATVDRVKVLASLSLDRHLTYVAMTRHREDLASIMAAILRQGRRPGRDPVAQELQGNDARLRRRRLLRAALRFADARGLHLVNVARTLARDRLEWTVRQKQKLVDLTARLATIGAQLGLKRSKPRITPKPVKGGKPMVSGITTFPKSIDQAVEDRLAADPGLKKQWQEVSTRFHHVYASRKRRSRRSMSMPAEGSRKSADNARRRSQFEPESFGALKGKTGIFAGAERTGRIATRRLSTRLPCAQSRALSAAAPRRSASMRQERAVRLKVSIDIPALSPSAKQTLERIRDAIDRNDLPAGLEYALADKMVKAELEGFAKAVSERFGERTFLPISLQRCKRRDLPQIDGRDDGGPEEPRFSRPGPRCGPPATRRA
jgi:hypothetical protein